MKPQNPNMKYQNPNIDLCIKAQLVNKVWVIDAYLIRPLPKKRGERGNQTRSASWEVSTYLAPYDTLAAALPGIVIDLDRGIWKGKNWSRKQIKAMLERRRVRSKR
jgi:hypothetical protein